MLPEKQLTLEVKLAVIVGPPKLDTFAAAEDVHPFASVTVTEYALEGRFVAFARAPPEGDQLYVKVPAPPLAFTLALPLEEPHVDGVDEETSIMAEGCTTTVEALIVQPLASVIVTE